MATFRLRNLWHNMRDVSMPIELFDDQMGRRRRLTHYVVTTENLFLKIMLVIFHNHNSYKKYSRHCNSFLSKSVNSSRTSIIGNVCSLKHTTLVYKCLHRVFLWNCNIFSPCWFRRRCISSLYCTSSSTRQEFQLSLWLLHPNQWAESKIFLIPISAQRLGHHGK